MSQNDVKIIINTKTNSNPIKKLTTKFKGVSIITCTNRPAYISNIFDNYENQQYSDKELIIILNNNQMDLEDLRKKGENFQNVTIFHVDEKETYGKCLNLGVSKSKYNLVALFDDDDYYGPKYLVNSIKAFNRPDVGVIGKSKHYIYFAEKKALALFNSTIENNYAQFLAGPTLIIKKEIFDKVKFKDITVGADQEFLKDCKKKGIRIFATDRHDFVYVRHGTNSWQISDKKYLEWCVIIEVTDNYKPIINKYAHK